MCGCPVVNGREFIDWHSGHCLVAVCVRLNTFHAIEYCVKDARPTSTCLCQTNCQSCHHAQSRGKSGRHGPSPGFSHRHLWRWVPRVAASNSESDLSHLRKLRGFSCSAESYGLRRRGLSCQARHHHWSPESYCAGSQGLSLGGGSSP